jgi:DNA-binding NtrC family response regulator
MIRKVLLVDPDLSSQEQCARILRDCRCEVAIADSTGAMTLLGKRKFDAAVLDFRAATTKQGSLPSSARSAQPGIKIILTVDAMSGNPTDSPLQLRGYTLLAKPLRIEEVAKALETEPETIIPEPVRTPTDPPPSDSGFAGMIGESEKMKKILRLVSKVALQRHAVLIMGESGTGKELVARAVHNQGPWHEQPFVPVDCGALPPTLIESELFGHGKGAFTGAAQSRQGLLASAGSGTIFLDEIGELPIELQSRLLRALQEHEIRPLGGNERTRFEARFVAATNQDL